MTSSYKLLIADASSLIFRGSTIITKDPQYKGGWSFLCRKIFQKIQQLNPSHVIVAGDGYDGNSTRREIQKDYKANRPQTPQLIKYQLSNINNFLNILNIGFISIESHEADDIIHTMVKQAISKNFNSIHIVADDKDLFSLLDNNRVYIHRLSKSKYQESINPITIKNPSIDVIPIKNFNVLPCQIPDFLALVGDSVDNIKGCPMVGYKRAQLLLNQYKNIDGIFNNIDDIKKKQKRIGHNLSENEQLIRMGLQMTKLKDLTNSLPKGIDDFLFDINSIKPELIKSKLSEIGLETLYKEIQKAQKEISRNFDLTQQQQDVQQLKAF